MRVENYEVNIRFNNFKILQFLNSTEELWNGIITIRKLFDFGKTVFVNLVYDRSGLERAAGQALPDWVIGMSDGKQIWILDKSKWKNPKMDLCQLILHEFVHVATGEEGMEKEPVWMKEGLAVYLSGQFEDYDLEKIQFENNFSFYDLSYQSQNLYFQSSYMIAGLVKEYGIKMVMDEMKDWKHSRIFQEENLKSVLCKYEEGLVKE